MELLDEESLALYFEKLPRDVIFIVDGKEYPANKQIICTFSPVLEQLILSNQDSAGNKIILDIKDNNNVFEEVLSFLHGKKIDINVSNDFYLNEIAQKLEITPLINAVLPSLQTEISIDNIVPRLIQSPDKADYLNFLLANIEELINDSVTFTLPINILQTVCTSPGANFKSENSKMIFKLKCCAHFPEMIGSFMTDEEFSTISVDVIQELVSNPEYQTLEKKIPSLEIAQRMIEKMNETQTLTRKIEVQLKDITEKLDAARAEYQKEQKLLMESDERLKELNKKYQTLSSVIMDISNRMAPHIEIIQSLTVTEEDIDKICAKVNFLQKTCDDMKFIAHRLQRTRLLYPDSSVQILAISEQWAEIMKPFHELIGELTPNQKDIEYLTNSFAKLTTELNEISLM